MKKILLLVTIIFLGHLNSIQAQQVEECATGIIHTKLMETDPVYAKKIAENERLIQQLAENPTRDTDGIVYEIPLVVHIVHIGESEGTGANISMTQINSAIDNLNNRYRNLHGPSVDTEVEFVLAQRDPDGNATTGVVRVDGSGVTNYATEGLDAGSGSGLGADEEEIKDLSRWPSTDYYNIWVVTEIEDNEGDSGIQGYAYYPGAPPSVDGTIIMNTCFGTTGTVNSWNNQGRTLVHELGHAFNLAHTFEGDADGTACPVGTGDNVADTDPHIRAASNCPTGTNSCTGGSIDGVTSNFMNYSSQTCALEFTAGQSTRLRDAIITSRPGLTTSLGGTAPAASSVVAASCTPTTTQSTLGTVIGTWRMTLNNIDMVSFSEGYEGSYIDHTQHQTIMVDEGGSYPIYIENYTGAGGNNENVAVFIDYNNNGDFTDSGETVFTSTGATTHTGTINIPASGSTTGTLLRMRVIDDFTANTITGPCYNPQYGQTEDYALEINAPLSIQDDKLNSFSVYPNPTSGILNIKGLTQNTDVAIYSIAGQLILKDKINLTDSKINVSELSSGIYFLNINKNTIKFIKK